MIGAKDVLRGNFSEEKHLSGFNGPMTSTGHFLIVPAEGLIWYVQKPFASKVVITPHGLVQSIGSKPVTQLSAQRIPFMLHLYDMLGGAMAGNWQALESDFDIARTQDENGWHAILVPHQKDNPAFPYSLISVSGHRFVDRVTLQKQGGDTDILSFTATNRSQNPPNAAEQADFAAVKP